MNPVIHGNITTINTDLNGSVPFANIADPDKATTDNIPRAYLNIMFFDERFQFIEEGSMALRVSQAGDGAAPLVLSNIKAPKNGYVYIYVSNVNDDAVYFDNFTVSYTRGRIIEENHYYAFGLRIAGISSVKFGDEHEGSLKNDYLYQGDFAELGRDIGWHDFALRNYDAQLGRFVQADPFGQFPAPYTGMGNDPVNLIDPSGGIGIPCPGASQLAIFFMKAGEAIGQGLRALGNVSPLIGAGIQVANVGAQAYSRRLEFQMISNQLQGNVTMQVGNSRADTIPGIGTKVMETRDQSWYESLWDNTPRSMPVDVGDGHTINYQVDENGYLTNMPAYTILVVPFIPDRAPFSLVKFFKGIFNGGRLRKQE